MPGKGQVKTGNAGRMEGRFQTSLSAKQSFLFRLLVKAADLHQEVREGVEEQAGAFTKNQNKSALPSFHSLKGKSGQVRLGFSQTGEPWSTAASSDPQLSLMGRSAPYLRRNLLWLWSTAQRGGRW